jgi:malonate decarboxylase beta subunit
MEQLNYNVASNSAPIGFIGASTGVVNSGNLEVLLIAHANQQLVKFNIFTTVTGYAEIWQAVVSDFADKFALGGLEFVIHDSGATPGVVALRLRQSYEDYLSHTKLTNPHYVELTPRGRINALVDSGSFHEIYSANQQLTSPHLGQLDLLTSFDDGVVIGDAQINGKSIGIIAQQANFMGGAVGEVHGAKIVGMCLRALHKQFSGVVLLLDSGGVRLQEANAGEIAISEIIKSIFALRLAGIPVVALVAGKNGAFGGIGITAACSDTLLISEQGRSGVSGPEVIETVMGVDEYDSKDRALVWRTCGGKHRALLGLSEYCSSDFTQLKQHLVLALKRKVELDTNSLVQQNNHLASLLNNFSNCHDATEIWSALGVTNPVQVPDLSDADFQQLLLSLAR